MNIYRLILHTINFQCIFLSLPSWMFKVQTLHTQTNQKVLHCPLVALFEISSDQLLKFLLNHRCQILAWGANLYLYSRVQHATQHDTTNLRLLYRYFGASFRTG